MQSNRIHWQMAVRTFRGRLSRFICGACVLLLTAFNWQTIAAQTPPSTMRVAKTITLAGVQGKFDHLAIDIAGDRLFIAATGNHSVEVIDLKTDKVQQSIAGLGKPHGLAWVAATSSLYVADGALAELRVYRGTPFALAGTIKLSDDADDMVYDDIHHVLFVGHGGSDSANPANVAAVDTDHLTLIVNLSVSTHPEALDFDPETRRVFANIADSNEVAVVDTAANAITEHWKVTKAAKNVPIAFDAKHQMIYIACRKPGMLIALDVKTGKEVAGLPTADGADDLFYDSALSRIYVITGSGEIDTYRADQGSGLHPLGVLHTAPGAKTALFVPSQNLLYVGIPGTDERAAEIRAYSTAQIGVNQ